MNESRESSLAVLLVRGLSRVRQRAERIGLRKTQTGNQSQSGATNSREVDDAHDLLDANNQQGDQ